MRTPEYWQSFLKCESITESVPGVEVFARTVNDTRGRSFEVICPPNMVLTGPKLLKVSIDSVFSAGIHNVPESETRTVSVRFPHEASNGSYGSNYSGDDVVHLRQSQYDRQWWLDLDAMIECAAQTIGHPRHYVDIFAHAVLRGKNEDDIYATVNHEGTQDIFVVVDDDHEDI